MTEHVRYPRLCRHGLPQAVTKVFDCTVLGWPGKLYWELRSFIKFFSFEGQDTNASKHIVNCWAAWSKRWDSFALGAQAHKPPGRDAQHGSDRGGFAYHTVSTLRLLHLLAYVVRHDRDKAAKLSSLSFLKLFVAFCFTADLLQVGVDLPSGGGVQHLDVTIDDGFVWAESLACCMMWDSELFMDKVSQAPSFKGGKVGFLDMLHACESHRGLRMAVHGFLTCLSKVLDAAFDELFGVCSDPMSAGYKPEKRKRLDYELAFTIARGGVGAGTDAIFVHPPLAARIWRALGGSRGPSAPQDKVLLRYFFEARRRFTFGGSMSVALDAGRVGKREWVCGVLAAACGKGSSSSGRALAYAMPPQAFRDNSQNGGPRDLREGSPGAFRNNFGRSVFGLRELLLEVCFIVFTK